MMLSGSLIQPIREVIFEGRLIALKKKDDGIRPIAIGYTLRRLAAKCVNSHVITARGNELKPIQVGVGVSGGVKAGFHAVRRFVETLEDDNVLVKLDFANAFKTIRRDSILERTAENTPELYKFVLATHKLSLGLYIILSREWSQHGDPLSGLEFCDTVHPIHAESQSKMKLGYMDDFKLGGRIAASDVQRIIDVEKKIGLRLMPSSMKLLLRTSTSSKTIQFSRTLRLPEKTWQLWVLLSLKDLQLTRC